MTTTYKSCRGILNVPHEIVIYGYCDFCEELIPVTINYDSENGSYTYMLRDHSTEGIILE